MTATIIFLFFCNFMKSCKCSVLLFINDIPHQADQLARWGIFSVLYHFALIFFNGNIHFALLYWITNNFQIIPDENIIPLMCTDNSKLVGLQGHI